MKGSSAWLWVILFFAVAIMAGWIKIPQFQPGAVQVGPTAPGACEIDETTLRVGAVDYVTGSSITSTAKNIVFNDKDKQIVSTTIDAYPDVVATNLPTNFNGYIMTGDDDGSGTDYYWVKTPVSWGCTGVYDLPNDIKAPVESSITLTGYDDGTAESTLNITVGTSKVTSTEIKISSESDKCIGNPYLSNPIMVCVNGSASTLAKFNEINPTGVSKSSYIPGFLTDQTSVKGCYVLPISALCDGAEDRRYWTIDPLSDPGVNDKVSICVIEKNYYQADDLSYVEGWEDVSAFSANADIGIPLTCIDMHFA